MHYELNLQHLYSISQEICTRFCCALLCCGYAIGHNDSHEVFIHIHQGCFAGTGAIVRLPQCQWSKPDGYGKISQCITTTKHSKAKTVCIFLGIYCNSLRSPGAEGNFFDPAWSVHMSLSHSASLPIYPYHIWRVTIADPKSICNIVCHCAIFSNEWYLYHDVHQTIIAHMMQRYVILLYIYILYIFGKDI